MPARLSTDTTTGLAVLTLSTAPVVQVVQPRLLAPATTNLATCKFQALALRAQKEIKTKWKFSKKKN